MRGERSVRDVFARALARINETTGTQFLPGLYIITTSLALNVRRKRSTDVRPFIPLQSEPSEVLDDGVRVFGAATIAIQIFDPQNQLALSCPRAFLRVPERNRMTKV